jgi:hypothetical protein
MSFNVKNHYKRPDQEIEYEELDEHEPRGIGSCCICNSNASLCTAERNFSSYVTSTAAQGISYWFW